MTMTTKAESVGQNPSASKERISYVKQMLGELLQVARTEHADLLVYLLEMAFTEAGDLLAGKSGSISREIKRNKAGGVSM